ncbi:MAG TPA: plastocyanin/azurin family copper-binding protein [Nitrosopumilaceae archaeon]|nr:plastocyanin/azurin family copper-binding protein [Nitrosopumilaceae archaeon]
MTAVDKAAIAWTIAIVVIGVSIASIGGQFQSPETPINTPSQPVMEKESAATTQPTLSKATMPGWDRIESVKDPGLGHEFHQLAVILPPSDKMYSGTITYDASEPVQLVSLKGPLGAGETTQQPIWTPDGKTNFALTLVDQKSAKGTWKFEGNALALHTMKTTKFIADYKLDYKESAAPTMEKTTSPPMKEESAGPKTVKVSVPAGTSVPGCEEVNKCYDPASVSIKKGDTVTWSNDDSAAHTVTSGSPTDGPSGVFDSSLFMAGKTFSHTFDKAGDYNYFCMVHPWMTGSVKVS